MEKIRYYIAFICDFNVFSILIAYLYMINKKTKTKVNYEIYKVYECSPYDLSCLGQNEDGKREVTIITCTPSGAKRVICKARAT